MKEVLTAEEARRAALAAQGFGGRRHVSLSPWRQIAPAIGRMGLLQLDSVNVLVRSHYLPTYSRIGAYDRAALDARAFAGGKKRALFEYWAHEASLLPLDLHPLMRWRMQRAAAGIGIYSGIAKFATENRGYVRAVVDEIRRRGPLAASELDDPGTRSGPWWGWHKGKTALEYLFWAGEVTTGQRRGFERVYDLPERVIPSEIGGAATPGETDAIRALTLAGARAHGVATEIDIRDYFRLPAPETRTALRELVEEGTLMPVRVEGWQQAAYLAADAVIPARGTPTALLSPFDPLVWHRPRTERIFDFHYRLEFYTPGPKRTFGYFVMPFLHRGRLEARVDLKADRAAGRLRVLGVFAEAKLRRPDAMLEALAEELRHLAIWLGLADIAVEAEMPLAVSLKKHVT
ncbi:MAG: crosslink repair DNA glycosylase YcaQ family protein [Candidatus Kaistia colombiensis]|nr:MAG: crosslink repair DNA glycosylase YcaQ family protein [Kaistia sp.]